MYNPVSFTNRLFPSSLCGRQPHECIMGVGDCYMVDIKGITFNILFVTNVMFSTTGGKGRFKITF